MLNARFAWWLALAATLFAGCDKMAQLPNAPSQTPSPDPTPNPAPQPQPVEEVTLLAAADIGFHDDHTGQKKTGELLDKLVGELILPGDIAYLCSTPEDYERNFKPYWDRHRWRTTLTAPGNHEYCNFGPGGYKQYFGINDLYYRRKKGGWQIYSLDSNIEVHQGSPQYNWLASELLKSENQSLCTLAFWHHPPITSSRRPDPQMRAIWRLLSQHGADLVLTGHAHMYERSVLLDENLAPSTNGKGMKIFIVGTGGAPIGPLPTKVAGIEHVINTWGITKFRLSGQGYGWEFFNTDQQPQVLDQGTEICR